MPQYTLGIIAPGISADKGSGAWCSEPQSAGLLAFKRALEMTMDTHGLDITVGADAVKHMQHYLHNTGTDYTLDMPAMLRKSAKLKRQYDAELAEAKEFAQSLGPGQYRLTSQVLGHGYFRQSDDRNLFFAIGGYSYWGQASVTVSAAGGGTFRYVMDFEFHFYDRYNWDKGKSVSIAGIKVTDDFMQQFHRQCYAREFDVRGIFKQQVTWQAQPIRPQPQVAPRNPFEVLMK